jgi:hypothetical protein
MSINPVYPLQDVFWPLGYPQLRHHYVVQPSDGKSNRLFDNSIRMLQTQHYK